MVFVKMRCPEFFLLLAVWIHTATFAPLNPKDSGEDDTEKVLPPDSLLDGPQTGLEYEKYLEQVIEILETNPEMREKLEGMTMEDLKNGKMAEEINMLDNNIRTELDEVKRLEIQRLRNIARKRMENGGTRTLDTKFVDNLIGHIDPADTNSFGPKDFEKLLKKATSDLEEADRRRKEDFKKYEMEKELRRRKNLQNMEEKEREEAIKQWEKAREERKNHPQMKHPGSKAQLEDVWEKTDHLERETFNPKTFFMLHDTNGDGKLDQFELEALFIKEVGKFYKDGDQTEMWEEIARMREHVLNEVEELYKGSKADPKEKFEEIYRMREHVMKEIDTDKDKLVTLDEFLTATKQEDFEKDEGWEDLQQQDQYTEEELEEYRAMYDEVVKEKKEKLRKEQEEYLKRRQDHGAGEPIVMDQERVKVAAGEAADEILKRMEEKKMKFDPNVANKKVEDLQAAQRQQEALAQRQAVQLQQAAQQAAQQQQQQGVPLQGSQNIAQAAAAAAAAQQQAAGQEKPGAQPVVGQPPGPNIAQAAKQAAAAIAKQQAAAQEALAQQQSAQQQGAQQPAVPEQVDVQKQGSPSVQQAAQQAAAAAQQAAALAQQQAAAAAQEAGGEGAQEQAADQQAPGGQPPVHDGPPGAEKMP